LKEKRLPTLLELNSSKLLNYEFSTAIKEFCQKHGARIYGNPKIK
jgi:hypothetical protein